MNAKTCCLLSALLLSAWLSACSKGPGDNAAPDASASVPPAPAPVAVAPAPAAGPRAEPARPGAGSVEFSPTQHLLTVTHLGKVESYRTAPLKPDLSGAEQQALVASVEPALRYPPERVTKVSGTYVREELAGGNALTALTYETQDQPAAAAQLYRGRTGGLGVAVHEVTTPLGDRSMTVFHCGLGEIRYRILIAPSGSGSRVEITQLRLDGAATQEWEAGQGVVRPYQVAEKEAPKPAAPAKPAAPKP
ncbi:MAG: hypothetical protein HYU66_05415 [Armatimonadetes bacterium]|nr:hypothetical protein [Armatimonadota bacterium]